MNINQTVYTIEPDGVAFVVYSTTGGVRNEVFASMDKDKCAKHIEKIGQIYKSVDHLFSGVKPVAVVAPTKPAKSKRDLPHTKAAHTCPHCGKEGSGPIMFRFHFDNCKAK